MTSDCHGGQLHGLYDLMSQTDERMFKLKGKVSKTLTTKLSLPLEASPIATSQILASNVTIYLQHLISACSRRKAFQMVESKR